MIAVNTACAPASLRPCYCKWTVLECPLPGRIGDLTPATGHDVDTVGLSKLFKGRARANLGDTMYTPGGVADLGGRILKWPKSDEKLCSDGTEGVDLPRQGRKFRHFDREIINFRGFGSFGAQKWISHF